MAKNVLTHHLSEPMNGATTAKVDIRAGDGNLTIDRLASDEPLLASGNLQYFENQGLPTCILNASDGQATLMLRRGDGPSQRWFRLPWATCNGATEWQIQLNPTVSADITAHSDGGNVKLNLTGMALSRVAADTGGGNVDLALPDNAANLAVAVKTGAGNVVMLIPRGVAARIHATSGLGRVIVDPRFGKIDKNIYQSSDYDGAVNRVEVEAKTGAGNVVVNVG